MAVRTYSLRADGDRLLAPNFRVREFASRCGADRILICDNLIRTLQRIRDHFGVPVTISSGFRTEAHNRRVGGATNSQHLRGTAADITVRGVAPLAVAQFAEHLGMGGIGLYATFTHVDTRAARARWDQRSGRPVNVSGFPGFAPPPQPTPPQPPPPPPIQNTPQQPQEDNSMTEAQVRAIVREEIQNVLSGNGTEPSPWAREEFAAAMAAGITDGTRPLGYATRQEMAIMTLRATQ